MNQESLFISVTEKDNLHIKKIYTDETLPPAVFIHGASENGRIFYSNSLKGTAPFFASNYTCYVIDIRGKGKSTPKLSRDVNYSHLDTIHDLKKILDYIKKLHPNEKQVWLAHSWGGVLINSMMFRYPEIILEIDKTVFFGTKRSISVKSLEKIFNVDIFYNIIFRIMGRIEGYIPPKLFGSDSEALDFHYDLVELAKMGPYVEPSDKFDYKTVIGTVKLPKCLTIAAVNDPFLGNKIDVERYMQECQQDYDLWLLSKENGNLNDYDHNDMLTHRDAVKDHLPKVLDWLREN